MGQNAKLQQTQAQLAKDKNEAEALVTEFTE